MKHNYIKYSSLMDRVLEEYKEKIDYSTEEGKEEVRKIIDERIEKEEIDEKIELDKKMLKINLFMKDYSKLCNEYGIYIYGSAQYLRSKSRIELIENKTYLIDIA